VMVVCDYGRLLGTMGDLVFESIGEEPVLE
jgi:hypothetical protein